MKFKYLIATIKILKIPGLFPVSRDWKAFVRTHFIYAALETGLLEALRIPCSREDLLGKLGVERPEILDALLRLGLSLIDQLKESGLHIKETTKFVPGSEVYGIVASLDTKV